MLGPYPLDSIITGDARQLAQAIPDASVDLIFTDPVYDRIEDYRWLAETAARVLKPDGALLVWQATRLMSQTMKAMEPPLNYVWTLHMQKYGPCYPGKTGICVITHCYWFDVSGTSKTLIKIADWIGAAQGGRIDNDHRWSKPIKPYIAWLNAFTDRTAIILDPFTGGGTVPAVCKILERRYLAFEIDPATANKARARVADTLPLLDGPDNTGFHLTAPPTLWDA